MVRSALIAVAILTLALPAQAFVASNQLIVESRPDGSFEVPYRGLSGASDFWCAAGDYVVRGLGMPVGTAIYRLSSPPRRGGQGMTFALTPEGATKTGLILLGGGRSISASHARALCDAEKLRSD